MIKIAPSILAADPLNLERDVLAAEKTITTKVFASALCAGSAKAYDAVVNPKADAKEFDPPEGWENYTVVLQGDKVTPDAEPVTGPFTVEPVSVTLIVKK